MNMSLAKSLVQCMAPGLRVRVPSHTRISSVKKVPQYQLLPTLAPSCRQFSLSTSYAYPRKDAQDKDSMNVEAAETSKSATDDESARQEDAAFDPDITDPQKQHEKAGEGSGEKNNPLDVSPANREVSKQRPEQEGGAQDSGESDRPRSSGGGSPNKGSKVA